MSSSGRRIYLDFNATAPLLPEAREALVDALDLVGNPSSVHAEGRRARALIEAARRDVAALVAASPDAVVFTSGATEAAVTCLTPRWVRNGQEIAVDALAVVDTDHPATREGGQFQPERVTRFSVDADGIVDIASLRHWLEQSQGRIGMLSVCLANGETGVVQPLQCIRDVIAGYDVLLVIDAVQAVGRMPIDIRALGADAVLLSGHKLGAAKGVGAFVLGDENVRPFRLLPGGGQERGQRSGTEAIPAISSFAAAAKASAKCGAEAERIVALRDRVVRHLRREGCRFLILGEHVARLDNTLALAVPGLRAETAQMALDLEGFAVSAGSACSSGKIGASHVLAAMVRGGLDADPTLGFIRVSIGSATTEAEVDAFAASFARLLLRRQDAANDLEAA